MILKDWLPVITLILGSLLTIGGGLISEVYRHRWASLEENKRSQVQRDLEVKVFQRDNILQLQEAGLELLHYTNMCFEEKWTTTPWIGAVDLSLDRQAHPIQLETDGIRQRARLQVDKLVSRVGDDELRRAVYELVGLSREVLSKEHFQDAIEAIDHMQNRFEEVNRDKVGPALRRLL
jgi:hypothetical protein